MSKANWNEAPEWAGALVESQEGGWFWVVGFGGISKRQSIHRSEVDDVFADMTGDHAWRLVECRPSTSPWDGEPRPPIGEIIEYLGLNESDWNLGKVVGFDCSMPVVRCHCGYVSAYNWRKYMSPEERAAQEREKSIAAMAEDMGFPLDEVYPHCAALLDAGYRKVEGGAQ